MRPCCSGSTTTAVLGPACPLALDSEARCRCPWRCCACCCCCCCDAMLALCKDVGIPRLRLDARPQLCRKTGGTGKQAAALAHSSIRGRAVDWRECKMEYRTVVRPRLVVSCPYVYGVAESAVRPVSAADCPPPFPRWNRVAYAQGRAVTLFLPPPSNHAQKHRRHAYTHTVGIHSWRERQEQPSDLFFQHVSLAGCRPKGGNRHSSCPARVSTATATAIAAMAIDDS